MEARVNLTRNAKLSGTIL